MTFAKRFLRILVLFLVFAAIGAAVLHHLSTRIPANYNPLALTEQQLLAASKTAEQKAISLVNLAGKAQANASATNNALSKGQPIPAAAQENPAPVTVTFTQDEINAAFWRHVDKSALEKYITSPYIALEENNVVLMGNVPDLGRVASAYFEPRIDENNLLRCDLTKLRLGNLPLPDAVFQKQREKVEASLNARLPTWQANAKMDPSGVTNADARAASLAKLTLQLLNHQPSPAALFIATADGKQVPVKLTQVQVKEAAITLTVEPMTTPQRQALLEQIKKPTTPAVEAPK